MVKTWTTLPFAILRLLTKGLLRVVAMKVAFQTNAAGLQAFPIALMGSQHNLLRSLFKVHTLTFFCLHRSQAFRLRPFSRFRESGIVLRRLGEERTLSLAVEARPMTACVPSRHLKAGKFF